MVGRSAGLQAGWRRQLRLLTLAIVLVMSTAGLTVVSSAPAAAVTVDTGTWYVLVNKNSGKALEVYNAATTNGARAAQWARNDGSWQQWKFVDSGSGYYRLQNRNSGKVLDVPAFSTSNGTGLDQWTDTNGTNVQFRLEDMGGGYIQLINRNSNKAVDVASSSTADGANAVQWTDTNAASQQWLLLPVDTAAQVTVNTNTWYTLVNRNSGKAMDDYNLSIANGARVAQYTRNDGPWQQWQFISSGNGYYRLRNQHSNKVLDVLNWSTANGASVVQWPDRNTADQQFRVVESANGYIRLINRNSGKAVGVAGSATTNGASVVQWTDLDIADQQWQLVPVGSVNYPDPLPVTGDLTTHDPTVVKKPDGSYLMAITDTGITLKTSTDRVRWTDVGRAFPNGTPWADGYTDPDSRSLWAPDLSYHAGTYYLYYSASDAGSFHSGIFLATSTTGNPGSWVNKGLVLETQNADNYNAIDPNLVVDDQGRWWLAFGSYGTGIKLVELDPATGKRVDNTMRTIADRSNGTGDRFYGPEEAAFIVKRGSYYYLYTSFDHCCADGLNADYRVMVARSTSVTGPYVDKYGLAATNGGGTEILAGHGAFHGTGHQEVLSDTDGDILFYHYYPDSQEGDPVCHYCKLGINRLGYDAQGWPYVY